MRPINFRMRSSFSLTHRSSSLYGICAALVLSASTSATAQNQTYYVQDEVLVEFKSAATSSQRQDVLHRVFGRVMGFLPEGSAAAQKLVRVQTGMSADWSLRALRNHPAVEFAEPNWIYQHQAVSNDPAYTQSYMWGLYGDGTTPMNAMGTQAGEAWAKGRTGSSSVVVGVIDEGIDLRHPDLAANIWVNPREIANNGIDDDKNGYIDDINGWDFASNDKTIYDGTPTDNNIDSHGTHVAGTIGAVGGNGIGVSGVNWNVKLIGAKFLGPNGGTTAAAVKAIDYFTMLKTRYGVKVVAINNSWGGGGYSRALHEAIIRAAKANILFVAAAGNAGGNNDSVATYPANYSTTVGTLSHSAASYDSVIAVSAIDRNGALPTWSNYGAKNVDLGAPGAGIVSTTPNNTYGSFNGTSMATPHVTGGIALYAASQPSATGSQIRSAILSSGVATSSLTNKTVTGRRLNVSNF